MIFLGQSTQIVEFPVKMYYYHLLLRSFQIIILCHPTIRHHVLCGVDKASFNKLTSNHKPSQPLINFFVNNLF